MAGEALEQSMLDGKDKDQLMAIAQALGIKVTARLSKASLIARILESTGVTTAPSADAAPATEPVAAEQPVSAPEPAPPAAAPAAPDAQGDGADGGADSDGEADDDSDDDDGDGDGEGDDGASGSGEGEQDGEGSSRRRRRRRRKNRGEAAAPDRVEPGRDRPDFSSEGFGQEPVEVSGYLDLRDEGYGFLRLNGFLPSRDDSYVPVKLARQYGLRKGDHLTGLSRPPSRNEKNPAMLEVHTVNGVDPDESRQRPQFDHLTAAFPDERLLLEDPAGSSDAAVRLVDLLAPLGKGQRALIASSPKAGRSTVLTSIAAALEQRHPEVTLMVLLVDERPEDVGAMRAALQSDVQATTFDRPSDETVHLAEMVIERAKRLVEQGDDVVLVLDGITRLGRAYNLALPSSGRNVASGIDASAIQALKRFFGAGRSTEEAGSLTLIATVQVDTTSRVDEAIFDELRSACTMEVRLDRHLTERRLYPAIDVTATSSQREELLFGADELQRVKALRRAIADASASGPDHRVHDHLGLEWLLGQIAATPTNAALLGGLAGKSTV